MSEIEGNEWKAKYEKVYESLGILQTQLDAALQKHKDDAAAFANELATLDEAWKQKSATAIAEKVAELEASHAKAVADLKASVLLPALQDMQRRQAADLAAKHEAEIAALR